MQKVNQNIEIHLNEKAIKYIDMDIPNDTFFFDLNLLGWTMNKKMWSKRAGIDKNISFHTSRHTFATLIQHLIGDIYTVSKLLGHTDITHIQRYATIIDTKKIESINKLSDF